MDSVTKPIQKETKGGTPLLSFCMNQTLDHSGNHSECHGPNPASTSVSIATFPSLIMSCILLNLTGGYFTEAYWRLFLRV